VSIWELDPFPSSPTTHPRYGLKTITSSDTTELHVPCDACGSSDARVNYDDGHGYCFSCETYFPPEGRVNNEDYTYQYLGYRGITKEVFQFYNSQTKVDGTGKPVSIGFVYPNNSVKVRQLDKKAFHSVGDIAKGGLFGRNKFAAGSHKYVTITEGELDALSAYQVLKSPCVSVRSSGSAAADCTLDRAYLNSFERIYIAFDGDGPGRSAAAAVARLFDYNKVFDVKFPGGDRKDANDYLRRGEESELRNIWWNSKKFLPDNIISSLADMEKELLTPPKFGISYPFPTLTHMTYGLRTGEVVLITAQEGVGKTEVMHTILHHVLKETDDAVGAIFLEESKQRLLQAMAGIELQAPVHLPDSGRSVSETYSALKQVVRTDDRLHVYSHFGSDNPEALIDTIRFLVAARGCCWIFFDLISLAVAGLGGDKEREALEYISARLEILTQELDFGCIIVSHLNDYNQTRGSRMIGKNCHVRIDLTRDVTGKSEYALKLTPEARDRFIRTTEATISKNRPAFRTGHAGWLLFDPITCTLKETFDVA
jgi:twinkle protein